MHRTPNPNVATVTGPVPREMLGVTLMHEHVLNDCTCWWRGRDPGFVSPIRDVPVSASVLSQLRNDPFACLDNCALDDEAMAITELGLFAQEGGATVVDPTCRGIGRVPEALVRVSEASGLNILMGSGYYLQSSHPARLSCTGAEEIARELIGEHCRGVGENGVPIGLIGEIGVSADFTAAERRSLRGAAMAALETGLPIMIHLPGWERLAHEVLDIIASECQPLDRVILCHMNPSWDDGDYQRSLADRGAFLEYDMIGMDYWYDDQRVQCPSDDDCAHAIVALVRDGYLDRLLLSQDVFLKMMLTPFGGNGYAHVQRHFLPRLLRNGLTQDDVERLMVSNPAAALCAYSTPETK